MLKPLVPFFSWRSCQSPPWLAAAPHTFFQTFRELLLHAAAVTTTSGIPPCDQGTIGTSRGMPPFQRFKKHGTHHKHSQTEKNCMQYWKYWQMYVDYLNISESYWDYWEFRRNPQHRAQLNISGFLTDGCESRFNGPQLLHVVQLPGPRDLENCKDFYQLAVTIAVTIAVASCN